MGSSSRVERVPMDSDVGGANSEVESTLMDANTGWCMIGKTPDDQFGCLGERQRDDHPKGSAERS